MTLYNDFKRPRRVTAKSIRGRHKNWSLGGLEKRIGAPGEGEDAELRRRILENLLSRRAQGTFTPDAPDEPLRGTVKPDFSSPRVPTAKTYQGRLKGMRTSSRKRRRDFGIGISRR